MLALVHRLRPRGVLWRNRDFLWLWGAQSVSQFGSQITALALPLVAIIVLDASAFEVAALGVVEWLPFLLFSLPAGAWIDRVRRRPILIAADWGRALALVSVPLAYLIDALTLGQLFVVGFLTGTLTMFFDLSYQSYLPSLVRRGELGEGNSKLEISRSGAQVAGPGLAGALVTALTAPYAILVDAVSFVLSALFLSRIRKPEPEAERSEEARPRLRTEIREGLRFVVRHPLLRPILIYVAVSNIFVSLLFAIFLVYAVRELQLSAQTIGLIFSLGNVGSLLGALTATRVARLFGIGPSLIGTATVGGFGLLLIPLAQGGLVIPFLVIANLLWGFYVLNYYVNAISLIQAITPDRLLGRTNASRRFVVQGVIPLGALLGGVLGSTIGLRPTLAIGAIGASVAVVPLFLSPLRTVRETVDADEIVRTFNEQFVLSGASDPAA
jgi:MFS family permease